VFVAEAGAAHVLEGDEAEVLLVFFVQSLGSDAFFEAGYFGKIELSCIAGDGPIF
jgi:hypothetical protein